MSNALERYDLDFSRLSASVQKDKDNLIERGAPVAPVIIKPTAPRRTPASRRPVSWKAIKELPPPLISTADPLKPSEIGADFDYLLGRSFGRSRQIGCEHYGLSHDASSVKGLTRCGMLRLPFSTGGESSKTTLNQLLSLP